MVSRPYLPARPSSPAAGSAPALAGVAEGYPTEVHLEPRLITVSSPRDPRAVVLVLHGGGSRRGRMRVSPTQLSVLRMIPIARRLARAGRGDLVVLRLLNSYRGWDTQHTPVDDVQRALAIARELYGDLPVGLVGHSLGGRAAILAGEDPAVDLVVALNPWVYPTDHAHLAGRRVVIAHGDADRVASLGRAMSVARSLSAVADVSFHVVKGGRHAMLRHFREFDQVAVEAVRSTLLRRVATT